ncbi:hypothetical protein QM600_10685 [Rhodococcus sp. IEGM 1379]|nr:hypothetical protein [Rhodococcus sp. IEGM 1379]MDI9915693.1 hypothetical protein [Rhodococcus sp. IEGM 1379]
MSLPTRGSSALCPGCNDKLSCPGGYHNAWCTHCKVGGNRDHVAGVNLAKRALLGRGKAVHKRGQNPEIRTVEHAPVRRSVPAATAPAGGESEKDCSCATSVGVRHSQTRSIARCYG